MAAILAEHSGNLFIHLGIIPTNSYGLVGDKWVGSFSNKCHFHFKVRHCRPSFLKPHHFDDICKILIKYLQRHAVQ